MWYIQEILYLLTTITIKLSIAILLISFPMAKFQRATIYATAVFYSLTGLGFIAGLIFQCSPIRAFWDATIDGKCVDTHIFGILAYVNAGISLVTDFIITVIPIKMIWGMHLQTSAKVSATFVFGLASL
jgi:hypothetical protein